MLILFVLKSWKRQEQETAGRRRGRRLWMVWTDTLNRIPRTRPTAVYCPCTLWYFPENNQRFVIGLFNLYWKQFNKKKLLLASLEEATLRIIWMDIGICTFICSTISTNLLLIVIVILIFNSDSNDASNITRFLIYTSETFDRAIGGFEGRWNYLLITAVSSSILTWGGSTC